MDTVDNLACQPGGLPQQRSAASRTRRTGTPSRTDSDAHDGLRAALLLPALIARAWPAGPTLAELLHIAAIDAATPRPAKAGQTAPLF